MLTVLTIDVKMSIYMHGQHIMVKKKTNEIINLVYQIYFNELKRPI